MLLHLLFLCCYVYVVAIVATAVDVASTIVIVATADIVAAIFLR
jgi:hypothetical protein